MIIVWERELKNDFFRDAISLVESQLEAKLTRCLKERGSLYSSEEWHEELKRRKEQSKQLLTDL